MVQASLCPLGQGDWLLPLHFPDIIIITQLAAVGWSFPFIASSETWYSRLICALRWFHCYYCCLSCPGQNQLNSCLHLNHCQPLYTFCFHLIQGSHPPLDCSRHKERGKVSSHGSAFYLHIPSGNLIKQLLSPSSIYLSICLAEFPPA